MEIRKNLGKGVEMIRYTKESPIEQLKKIGRDIRIRKQLEKQGEGVPKYTKSQKKKIKKEMNIYFNSLRK
jgi:hypothetical protein